MKIVEKKPSLTIQKGSAEVLDNPTFGDGPKQFKFSKESARREEGKDGSPSHSNRLSFKKKYREDSSDSGSKPKKRSFVASYLEKRDSFHRD